LQIKTVRVQYEPMKRYAFIDVHNTASTAQHMLGIVIDWGKLCDYLKNKRSCTEVFLYTGIDQGDIETANEFEALSKMGCCTVRSKVTYYYKNKDKIITLKCLGCGKDNIHTVNMGHTKKSNCDVELSVDAIEKSAPGVELMIFTADGDFEYLIRRALEKGVERVEVVSYAGKATQAGVLVSRFSTKLQALIKEKPDKVIYTSLKDIKDTIKKVIPAST